MKLDESKTIKMREHSLGQQRVHFKQLKSNNGAKFTRKETL